MCPDISEIDKNLKVETVAGEKDMVYHDVRKAPFKIYGLYDATAQPEFKRLPDEVASAVNDGVAVLGRHTAGGRVRFKTDSRCVALKAVMPSVGMMPHMTLTGSSGFDLYINKNGKSVFYKSFIPPVDMKDGYESVIYFNTEKERDITINFPLYNELTSLFIGIKNGASLTAGDEYKYRVPVVYYGSSITQGGCASRPGNSYQAIISRMLDCDYVNLGFSGSARGEQLIADYIAGLDMSVFVCDYDHNAPNPEHLSDTHMKFYETVRKAHPELPVIFVSKPDFENGEEESIKRRSIIFNTHMQALGKGDKNIYYIDGKSLFGNQFRDSCTVDSCHPNDLGFMRMAEVIGASVSTALYGI